MGTRGRAFLELRRDLEDRFRGRALSVTVHRAMTRLLTVDEVAERLGVTKDWVWAQARAGRIPHVRLGRYRRFREEAIDAWLQQLEQSSLKP